MTQPPSGSPYAPHGDSQPQFDQAGNPQASFQQPDASPQFPVQPYHPQAGAAPGAPGPYGPMAGYPGPGQYQYQYRAAPAPGINLPGMWSMICFGAGLVLTWLPWVGWLFGFAPLAGVVLGIVGLSMDQYRDKRALAGWGLGLNIFLLVVIPVLFVLFVVFGLAFIPWLAYNS
ncbi:hypothetical protein [Gulosibacter sp. 10]|uniref:hypothetical protein n=1 Tax=Gulosibacter sp. 10 TaxID=1255570 RepID=UPI00097EB43B|nr:hypothetical protein [Gulosibacter sp. 10]SJM66974.1 hypothetical protein FM112_12195 [Gulosibacter sp. 10]